jgi:hypothetical protein
VGRNPHNPLFYRKKKANKSTPTLYEHATANDCNMHIHNDKPIRKTMPAKHKHGNPNTEPEKNAREHNHASTDSYL